jgi:hypothetical protein
LINGSFENGFDGWHTTDLIEAYHPLQVAPAGTPEPFQGLPTAPTDGTAALLNGFDGGGPGEISVGQDVAIGAGLTLAFDWRAAWENFGNLDRVFEVRIEPPGGGSPLQTTQIVVAAGGTMEIDTGWTAGMIDMSPFAGQSVFIRFTWIVPEEFTGPASAQLDAVRLQ